MGLFDTNPWLNPDTGQLGVAGDPATSRPAVPSPEQFAADYKKHAFWNSVKSGPLGLLGALSGDVDPVALTSAYNALLQGSQGAEAGRLGLPKATTMAGLFNGTIDPQTGLPVAQTQTSAPAAPNIPDGQMPPGPGLIPSMANGGVPPAAPSQPVGAAQPPQAGLINRLMGLPTPGNIPTRSAFMASQFAPDLFKAWSTVDPAVATAKGEAPYKALTSLAGQAGRAVKLSPGDSATTGFENMPPDARAALGSLIGEARPGGSAPGAGTLASLDPTASSGIFGGNGPTGSPDNPVTSTYNSGISGIAPAYRNGAPSTISNGNATPPLDANGFPVQPTRGQGGRLQNPLTLQGATLQKDVLPKQFETAGANYSAAQNLMGQLDMVDHNIDTLNQTGWSATGTGANVKMGAIKGLNSFASALGMQPPYDPQKIATWEDFNKESTRMGFELAKTLGSREAQMIVQQAVSAVPNSENTYLGARLVSSSLRQAAQRQSDYYEFLTDYANKHGGTTMGADIAFNKATPVNTYTNRAIAMAVPDGARAMLLKSPTPAVRAQFDAVFGKGMAQRVMQVGQ